MNAPLAGPISVAPDGPGRVDAPAAIVGSSPPRRGLRLAVSTIAMLVLAIGLFAGLIPAASAAGAAVNQCNGVYNTGGRAVECHVIIQNRLNLATGVSSSTSTIQACHGAAGAAPLCTTTPIDVLTDTINQCNGSALGGGATLLCTVQVTNTITGNGTSAPVTVDQCIGSGGGGGTQPTTNCSPVSSTTNADITQCNGSANNGGASRRVTCTVTPSTSSAALPITINQCNDSAAGGSTVTCTASITNIFVPATTTAPPTTAPPTTAPPTTAPATTASSSRPRPSGSVRPTIASRPTSSATATTTPRTTTSGSGTAARSATSTSTNGVGTGTTSSTGSGTTSSNSTTTSLASTGVPAIRQALLAAVLLAAGAALMVIGRKTRRIGKHR